MPRRKRAATQPLFTFIAVDGTSGKISRSRLRAKIVRSHAAYWGSSEGQVRRSHVRRSPPPAASIDGVGIVCSTEYDFDNDQRNNVDASHDSPRHLDDVLSSSLDQTYATIVNQYAAPYVGADTVSDDLGRIPMTSGVRESQLYAHGSLNPSTTSFFGFDFFSKHLEDTLADMNTFSLACSTVATAYRLATTGSGCRTSVLNSKAEVLKAVSQRVIQGSLSSYTLGSMLMMGAPILCLVTHDLPDGLDIMSYIEVTKGPNSLCCANWADAAQTPMQERYFHWKGMQEGLRVLEAEKQNRRDSGLLKYLNKYMSLSLLFDASGWPDDLMQSMVDRLLVAEEPCNKGIASCWTSPLTIRARVTCQVTTYETPIVLIADLTRDWLATMLDFNNLPLDISVDLLAKRKELRNTLNNLPPQMQGVGPVNAAMYAACHWAMTVMLKIEEHGISIEEAALLTQIQPRLVVHLRNTDLDSLWGDHCGCLFWVCLVCHAATIRKCFPLLSTALLTRFAHEQACSSSLLEAGVNPFMRLRAFERLCCQAVI